MEWVDGLVVRDVGSVPAAFQLLDELLADTPDDAKKLFSPFIERLRELRGVFIARNANDSDNGDNGRVYTDAIEELVILMTPYAKQILAGRVVQHLKLKRAVRAIHEILDGVYSVLRLSAPIVEEAEDWLVGLNEDMPKRAEALGRLVESAQVRDELERDVPLFVETMTLLQHARESRDPEKWNPLAKKFYEIVLDMNVAPDVRARAEGEVPGWFVPSTDVRYHPKPFASGTFGTVHHGIWGSSTPVVVKILHKGERLSDDVLERFVKR